MAETYKIGTRTSPLAIKQVEEVLAHLKEFYPGIKAEVAGIDTYGDKDKTTPISSIEGTDFFTREIDEALLRGDIDFGVHSAKDLPDNLTSGIFIAAITRPVDPYDALISKKNLKIDEIRYGAKIGTSSLRRKMQLKNYREDFQIIDIRGNIEERLTTLDGTDLDAIVAAAAGLIRLGLEDRITERISFEILKPHPLQGSLAVVVRIDDLQLREFLSVIDYRRAVLL